MSKRAAKRTSPSRVVEFGIARVHEPRPARPTPAAAPLTQDDAIEALWSAKTAYQTDAEGLPILDETGRAIPNPKWCDVFVYATLRKDVPLPYDEGRKPKVISSGTRVLVTMVSRFGDVGIRATNLVPASDGYSTRVQPEDLCDWNMAP